MFEIISENKTTMMIGTGSKSTVFQNVKRELTKKYSDTIDTTVEHIDKWKW